MTIPAHVRIVEVAPRDGLQNEAQALPVDVRVRLIEELVEAGLKTVECGSFVSSKWVPQMADTAAVSAVRAASAWRFVSSAGSEFAGARSRNRGGSGPGCGVCGGVGDFFAEEYQRLDF